MNVYCRECGGLLVEEAEIMNTYTFKLRYGDLCVHCKTPLSDHFNIIPSLVNNEERGMN